jgi:NhaP-type Na+/H+ or K+/H+ antiporter
MSTLFKLIYMYLITPALIVTFYILIFLFPISVTIAVTIMVREIFKKYPTAKRLVTWLMPLCCFILGGVIIGSSYIMSEGWSWITCFITAILCLIIPVLSGAHVADKEIHKLKQNDTTNT